MKKQAYMIATMIVMMTVAGVSTARAQTSSATQLTANIPFEFSVGNQTMPAGEYTVRCTNPASDMKVLQLRRSDRHASATAAMVQTSSVIGKTQVAKLVFNRYGDRYFFSQAWMPSDNIGMQASKSRSEKHIARELAANRKAKESVTIAARR